ncbi:DEAD/DEAH box helicase [Sediminibacillus albus]|uniref:Superfamily II DNA and RNA helicase n=1 Tax=Sediminibacillus albus TaxID=407036 RepID=A0A1G8WW08_9BACI|nr:DEAD/DEAH box helicase [Sediminibacillus albus]SDJ81795.1 Superfamily II DNA and RNA helicase [Sediminibacillus albus]
MAQGVKALFTETKPFMEAAWDKSEFSEPTAIQLKAVPKILEGKDVIAESPTGSGKTLAYILPLLQKIDPDKKHVQAVILASSHELVMQIHQEIQSWAAGSGIGSASLIGGANIKRQLEKLKKRPQIVAGTPGRIQELINKKKLKMHEVKTLVLDEADQLLVPEHQKTVEAIIKSTLTERQLLVFSATISETVEQSAKQLMDNPEVIRIGKEEIETPPVDHMYLVAEPREKLEVLRKLIRGTDEMKALAFGNDIGNLTVLAEKLEYKGISAGVLHGDSKKQERAKTINGFRAGTIELVLATDVAARGLDIKDITHIINIDLPATVDQYIHRAGRIGRLGTAGGSVISIITAHEEKQLRKYSKELNIELIKKTIFRGRLQNAD